MLQSKNHLSSYILNFLRVLFDYQFPPLGKYGLVFLKKILPRYVRTELFPNITVSLDLNDLTMLGTFWQGKRFEFPTGQILIEWCKNATKFFDIGSNYGFYSWWMRSQFPNLDIYLFEPNTNVFNSIEEIIKTNNLRNIYTNNIGLGDKNELLPLFLGISDTGHSTFGPHPNLVSKTKDSIPIYSFDEWLKIQQISFPNKPSWVAKIDVEGFELKVLYGMEKALKSNYFIGLVIEFNEFTLNFCKSSSHDIENYLYNYGYVYYVPKLDKFKKYLVKHHNKFFVLDKLD